MPVRCTLLRDMLAYRIGELSTFETRHCFSILSVSYTMSGAAVATALVTLANLDLHQQRILHLLAQSN